jgi:hypothetical protein
VIVIIHCSDSPQGRGDNAATIHGWHTSPPRSWDGIGYHHVILEDGTVENGRPPYWSGAHVRGHNKGSIGICLIGVDRFTTAQLRAVKHLIGTKYPDTIIKGHYELDSSKTCPNMDMDRFRSYLDTGLLDVEV